MKILILGGFLGSGKTSLLMHIAHRVASEPVENGSYRVMILENEVGNEGVDDKLLRGSGYSVQNLFAGCACCSLAGQLVTAIEDISRKYNPDWIIIEATGLAFPLNIRENLLEELGLESGITVVVDANRFNKLMKNLERMLCDQLKGADNIILNKVDMVSEEETEPMISKLQEMNDTATIYKVSANNEIPEGVIDAILEECIDV